MSFNSGLYLWSRPSPVYGTGGRYLHKIDTDGGFHVLAQDLDSPVVDSLIIAGVFGR